MVATQHSSLPPSFLPPELPARVVAQYDDFAQRDQPLLSALVGARAELSRLPQNTDSALHMANRLRANRLASRAIGRISTAPSVATNDRYDQGGDRRISDGAWNFARKVKRVWQSCASVLLENSVTIDDRIP